MAPLLYEAQFSQRLHIQKRDDTKLGGVVDTPAACAAIQ